MTTLVLRNARVHGHDGLVDLSVVDGIVTRVEPSGGIDDAAADGVEQHDLEGRTVIPGLWDHHVHMSQWALTTRRLDLSVAGSADEAIATVAAALGARAASVATAPGEEPETLVGANFRDGLWPDTPTTAALDAATGDVPVVLVSGDLHCCWVNSAAFRRYGVAPAEGLLREDDCFALVAQLGTVPDAVLDRWVDEASLAAAARGVVGIVDLDMQWNLPVWRRRIAAGSRALRVSFGTYREHLDTLLATRLRTGDDVDGTDGLVRVGPFKVITDGSLNTRTAYCAEPYPGEEGVGQLNVPPVELESLLARVTDAGLDAAVHAIGDRANTLALDAFDATGARGSIEHAQLVADDDLERFAELGVVASVQPEHAVDDRDVADRYWAGRTERAFPLRSLLDAGATLALGSDAPVAPLDPWIAIAAAVTRQRGTDAPWHGEQAITVAEAIAASVRPGTGPVVGAVADLAILDADPYEVDPATLRTMPVHATLLAGRFTYQSLVE